MFVEIVREAGELVFVACAVVDRLVSIASHRDIQEDMGFCCENRMVS